MLLNYKIILCATLIIAGCNSGYHDTMQQSSEDTSNSVNNRLPEVVVPDSAVSKPNSVIGDWKFNDNENMGDDDQSTIVMNGTVSFNADNVYNYSATIIANVYNKETQLSVPLSYKYEETGKWSVDDNNIMAQTVTQNRLTANNDAAQEFENDNPNGGVRDIIPLQGTESHYQIKNLTSDLLDLVEQSDKHHETVYHKQ